MQRFTGVYKGVIVVDHPEVKVRVTRKSMRKRKRDGETRMIIFQAKSDQQFLQYASTQHTPAF
jgi:hypothetical protein